MTELDLAVPAIDRGATSGRRPLAKVVSSASGGGLRARDRAGEATPLESQIVYGINPVLVALRAGRVRRILVAATRAGSGGDETRVAAGSRRRWRWRRDAPPVERVDAQARMAGARRRAPGDCRIWTRRAITASPISFLPRPRAAAVVVLDGVEDPHNVAQYRTADAAGCHGVIRQARHAQRSMALPPRSAGLSRTSGWPRSSTSPVPSKN